ncbi:hypothetical protein JTE90_023350 [Oedothorax gibbosus]|uniref:Uncharacterized protein n=1 Tax=Oedothorax gibbosus TaxID=931172 RepID=A0AAV6THB8_9ARAC|nr:hypothetical protein JTE90_023350 [Oedothorax gibbosus]
MCASQGVLNKPGGEIKSTGRRRSAAFRIPVPSRAGRTGDPAAFHLWKWRSLSAHVGTRKRWKLCPDRTRPEETLVEVRSGFGTCKSIVRSGSSGVRLIEPSSSGSLRSFPQDSWRSLNSVSSGKAND